MRDTMIILSAVMFIASTFLFGVRKYNTKTCTKLISEAKTHTDSVVVFSSRPSLYSGVCIKYLK